MNDYQFSEERASRLGCLAGCCAMIASACITIGAIYAAWVML